MTNQQWWRHKRTLNASKNSDDWKNRSEEWYELIKKFAIAQELMGVKKTLDIKLRIMDRKPSVNYLSVAQMQKLLNALRKEYKNEL